MAIKLNIILAVAFFINGIPAFTQVKAPANDTISQRIIFIADAGQLTNGRHPVVDAVRNLIPLDSNTTVLFLGDNLYQKGLPDIEYSTYRASRAIIDTQISLVKGTKANLWMVPGNHDWENGGRDGYSAVMRQQLYVAFLRYNNVRYVPDDGCPGPIEVSVGNDITLILFDSQWWLHPYDKPEIESDCSSKTTDELVNAIADIAAKNAKKLVILGCHHPFKSNGIHGGYFTFKQHMFPFTDIIKKLYIPLPIIGSAYPISRSVFGSPQDIKYPAYQKMINDISGAIKRVAPNLVFAAGHDHNLQLIRDSSYYYIVSGGGSKQSRTSKSRKSLFNSRSEGFSVMEISKNKNVNVTFYTVTDSVKKYDQIFLMNFSKPVIPVDSISRIIVEDPFLKFKDTTTQAITNEFEEVKGFKRFFMGENYRREWTTPVNMRVFNLSKEKGGFNIRGLGGGLQTQSLQLTSKEDGKSWVLRTVNKNPKQTIPEAYHGTLGKIMLRELKSASYPYGGLIVPGLTGALGLQAPSPELFFVPDDPGLGFYRDFFKNKVCMLEKSNPTFDGSNTRTTPKIFNEVIDDNDHRVMEPHVLRARLLDFVIADYDRHMDQWKWDTQDTGKGKIYFPIPRDRDQSFFYSNGLMLKLFTSHNFPFLKGFRPDIPKPNWLAYTARDFDRIYLTDLDQNDWQKEISFVKSALTDSVITSATLRLPPEIYNINGPLIARKMISRRNVLEKAAMTYYRFVSQKVNIIGSNKKEYFKISDKGNGKIQVRVYARDRDDTSFIMYDRVFDPKVTHEIRMYGLNESDIFEVEENVNSSIKLRMIGGQEYDTFYIKGRIECLLYDVLDTGNAVINSSHAKKRFSRDSPVNESSILNFKYDYSRFPQLHFAFNSDDHFYAGMAFSRRTFGFRNDPYASDQNLHGIYAFDRKAWQLNYRGELNHITRNIDLVMKGTISFPYMTNFFGFGNGAKPEPGKSIDYYQVRYNKMEVEALIRKRYFEKFHVSFGPYYYSYSAKFEENRNTVLGKASQMHLDSTSIFSRKSYLGLKVALVVDNRNNELWPSRGVLWKNNILALRGLNNNSHDLVSYTSDMTIYASFNEPAKLIAVMKIGGGRNFNRNFEYFQAMSLGLNDGLNGFRKNRYVGKSVFYSSLEFRIKVMEVNSYVLPGQFGVTVFGNMGKVHSIYDQTRKWHGAYGFGFFYLPFHLYAITGSVGFHKDEKIASFSLGTRFNLSY